MTTATEAPVVLASWQQPNGETIRLRRNHHGGEVFLDLRAFNPDTTAGEGLPTAAGLCLTGDRWQEIIEGLQVALAADEEADKAA